MDTATNSPSSSSTSIDPAIDAGIHTVQGHLVALVFAFSIVCVFFFLCLEIFPPLCRSKPSNLHSGNVTRKIDL